jgi:predicted amidohydrolase
LADAVASTRDRKPGIRRGSESCRTEPQFHYAGRSVVIDPHGIIIADAGEQEGILTAEIDVEKANAWRRDFPALDDAHWHAAEPASEVR